MIDKNSEISLEQQARIEIAVETLAAALRPKQKIGFFFQCVIDSVEGKSNGRVEWIEKQEGRFGTGLKHLVSRERELFTNPCPHLVVVTEEVESVKVKPAKTKNKKAALQQQKSEAIDFNKMKMDELKAYAKERNIVPSGDKRKKATWVEALVGYWANYKYPTAA